MVINISLQAFTRIKLNFLDQLARFWELQVGKSGKFLLIILMFDVDIYTIPCPTLLADFPIHVLSSI